MLANPTWIDSTHFCMLCTSHIPFCIKQCFAIEDEPIYTMNTCLKRVTEYVCTFEHS